MQANDIDGDDHGVPLSALTTGEALLTMALRLWLESHSAQIHDPDEWSNGLAIAGLRQTEIDAFDTLASAAIGGARGRFHLHQPWCPGLGRDEARLLQALALLQHGRRASAEMALTGWLTRAAIRLVLDAGMSVARRLGARGLPLPVRTVTQPSTPVPAAADAGLHRLQ
jgi:hypothetical protein